MAPIPHAISGSKGWARLRAPYRDPLVFVMRLVALVLLIACANVANLLLARASARQREIAVRLAIGASRARIVRQLLTESLLLAGLGAAAGLTLAQFASQALLQLVSGTAAGIPLDLSLNWRVLAFTTGIAAATGLLFGVAPALRATAAGPAPALKKDTRSAGSRSWLASGLVVAQVALSLVAIVGAGLLLRTLRNLHSVNPGFRHEGVLLADIDSMKTGIDRRSPRLALFYRELLEAIRRAPGVQAASLSNNTPLSGGVCAKRGVVGGRSGRTDDGAGNVNSGSHGFFGTMQAPLAAGRDFTEHDDAGSSPVASVNEAFVKRYLNGAHLLGERVSVKDSPRYQNMEIVGVVHNSIGRSLRLPSPPTLYMPIFQAPQITPTLEVYAGGSLSSVSAAIAAELKPRLPGAYLNIRGFTRQVEGAMRRERLLAVLAGFFGGLALLLSVVGLYGLLAYVVLQRTGEIGIRMALGAQQRQVLWMVLRNALRLAGAGIVIGLPAAWWASRFVSSMVFGIKPTDPATMFGAAAMLGAAALAAGVLPARRASHVDPMVALRYE